MKRLLTHTLAITLFVGMMGSVLAIGLKKGDTAGIFYVTKIAGAENDGVAKGQELCYRCRYGSSPIVMVFTRNGSSNVQKLVQQLDQTVHQNADLRMKGIVTFIGSDVAVVKESANIFAEQTTTKHVPIVVAKDTESGPENYKLDDSEVTIVVANDSQIVATYRFQAAKLNASSAIKNVMAVIQQRDRT